MTARFQAAGAGVYAVVAANAGEPQAEIDD
jgi:hypothetical protein